MKRGQQEAFMKCRVPHTLSWGWDMAYTQRKFCRVSRVRKRGPGAGPKSKLEGFGLSL